MKKVRKNLFLIRSNFPFVNVRLSDHLICKALLVWMLSFLFKCKLCVLFLYCFFLLYFVTVMMVRYWIRAFYKLTLSVFNSFLIILNDRLSCCLKRFGENVIHSAAIQDGWIFMWRFCIPKCIQYMTSLRYHRVFSHNFCNKNLSCHISANANSCLAAKLRK